MFGSKRREEQRRIMAQYERDFALGNCQLARAIAEENLTGELRTATLAKIARRAQQIRQTKP